MFIEHHLCENSVLSAENNLYLHRLLYSSEKSTHKLFKKDQLMKMLWGAIKPDNGILEKTKEQEEG